MHSCVLHNLGNTVLVDILGLHIYVDNFPANLVLFESCSVRIGSLEQHFSTDIPTPPGYSAGLQVKSV